ncbi:hypothetical protein ACFL1B_05865 [Nanoarchaeota archaeon]
MERIEAIAVCGGGIQRSPTMQAVLNFEAANRGIQERFLVTSAGIRADAMLKNSPFVPSMQKIMEAAMHYGIVQVHERSEVRYDLDHIARPYGRLYCLLLPLFKTYSREVIDKLVGFRNDALIDARIPESLLPDQLVQYDWQNNASIVLPVDMVTKQKISSTQEPGGLLVMYGDLVGKAGLDDDVTGGFEEAKRQVDYFMDTRVEALDKILEIAAP